MAGHVEHSTGLSRRGLRAERAEEGKAKSGTPDFGDFLQVAVATNQGTGLCS